MVTAVDDETAFVVIVNVAVFDPAATVTVAGKVATDVLLDVRFTTVPPVPALPLSVTVPVELFPPTTEVGETETDASVAGLMVKVAF